MKIGFIGGGNMGEAMIAALIRKRIATPHDIIASDAAGARRQQLAAEHGVRTTAVNRRAASGADVVVLAVKPQVAPTVLTELKGKLKPGQLVVSIMAGVPINTMRKGLNHAAIVRSMPNTPARIGEGMTVWTATPEVTGPQRQMAAAVLGAMGKEMAVDDERYLDMATAVSGSGPAYLFYFVEAFVEAAVGIGWTQEQGRELVMSTILGAAHLLQETEEDASELRRQVTSPGGTTAAAIGALEAGGFKELVAKAVKAAHERAGELGK